MLNHTTETRNALTSIIFSLLDGGNLVIMANDDTVNISSFTYSGST